MKIIADMNRLIIADIRSNNLNGVLAGHFIPVAKNFLDAFRDKAEVLIAGGPIFKKAFSGKYLLELPYDYVIGLPWLKNKIATLINCKVLFEKATNDTIILQHSSAVTAFGGIFLFAKKNSIIYMIQYSNVGLNNSFKRLLYHFAKKKIKGIICPNEEVGKAFGLPYCVVPDYLYTPKDETKDIPFSEKRFDFCMLGRMSKEKGMVGAAKALRNTKYKVLIAGRPDTKELELAMKDVCQDCNNIKLIMDYISDEDYLNYLSQSRYCVLNYSGEYSIRSSGVVFDTIFHNVPVVGKNCKALQFIGEQKIGTLFDSIQDVEWGQLLDADVHECFLANIRKYCKMHINYINKLYVFLNRE